MKRLPMLLSAAVAACALLSASGCVGQGEAGRAAPKTASFQHAFDQDRAFADLKAQCAFGPRNPGSEGHARCLDWIKSEIGKTASKVTQQKFTARAGRQTFACSNVIAVYRGEDESRSVLLGAHWDTRPKADQDIDAAAAAKPIIGANDGASGVAVLMELGRQFAAKKPPLTVVMVFFDAEDMGGLGAEYCLGSAYFARGWKQALRPLAALPKYGIVLDMVGAKDLRIPREQNSDDAAGKLMDTIYRHAAEANLADVFPDETGLRIQDDHVPLIEAGLPCVDLIGFDYAYWHTQADTSDKCSPASLRAVGEVTARTVYGKLP